MYWKLRIPLFLLTIGVISGLYQKFPWLFLVDTNYFIRSALFIGTVGLLYILLEKNKINDKKVHFTIGLLFICIGFAFDHFMV
ncbi:hypothetical protein NOM01_07495 [Sporolactobacillus sp. STSJ-5]|uniref:hypothetical protein n=1 Tax=Sporolactobacillus sp. STSJ-5 TaxID=2965076 RepID=UPI002107BB35|nr:hypothetical protein [Sporolactobacillus sp. STSJ-5]MCQ2009849.1 hypothetical protein [Sporolactobacillus sp. STSJ-5]